MSPDNSVPDQLNYLKKEMRENDAGLEMQKMFPEGYVFMNALYGLTWCETALRNKNDSVLCKTAAAEALFALKKLESDEAKKVFDVNCSPEYGMFYQSWTNYLRGKILLIIGININPGLAARYLKTCGTLSAVFNGNKSPFPESYKHASWPADAFPGIVSLKIHDKIFPAEYEDLITGWLHRVKDRVDPQTGLIPHMVNSITGMQTDDVRGSSLSLIIRLLAEIDQAYACEQFLLYRKLFADEILGITVIKEYQPGYDKTGDIDSGPVILGAGSAATIVGIGTAKACGDNKLAAALISTVEFAGMPLNIGNEKKYLFGELPVADMFIAWSKSAPQYFKLKEKYESGGQVFLIISILLTSVLLVSIIYSIRRLR